jgi:hypothetical protein
MRRGWSSGQASGPNPGSRVVVQGHSDPLIRFGRSRVDCAFLAVPAAASSIVKQLSKRVLFFNRMCQPFFWRAVRCEQVLVWAAQVDGTGFPSLASVEPALSAAGMRAGGTIVTSFSAVRVPGGFGTLNVLVGFTIDDGRGRFLLPRRDGVSVAPAV